MRTPFLKIAIDEFDQRLNGILRIRTGRPEMQLAIARRLQRHHLGDTFCINPRPLCCDCDIDAGAESLGKLCQFDRWTRMQARLVYQDHIPQHRRLRNCHTVFILFNACDAYCGDSSSAIFLTRESGAPLAASVAAMTAPSTMGALQTTTLLWRSSGSISIAISLLVSAPPTSTRIATPASLQARSMAPMIAGTLVPRPPPA